MDENHPPRSAAAPSGNDEGKGTGAIPGDSTARQVTLGRAAVPPDLNDPERRQAWGLPADEGLPGEYMVELNVAHQGGLRAANFRFAKLYARVVADEKRKPIRVGQTYFHCRVSVTEWRELVDLDENLSEADYETAEAVGGGTGGRPAGETADSAERGADGKIRVDRRAIYRIWPDFPIKPQINHSVATIKADAALLSYAASGKGIVWAVLDSGIDAGHPHFGLEAGRDHTLLAPSVIDLHRDFSKPDLPDPDADPSISDTQRREYLDNHRRGALTDNYHHGTHVAGIIAGGLTKQRLEQVDCRVFERKFNRDDRDRELPSTLEERTSEVEDPTQLHGVAPFCRLISLKVLDDRGFGRSSNVLRALDYIRLNLNANPKTMLVHGINLSVGYEFDAQLFACGQSPICVEVDRLVQSGVVVVAAAGNTGYGTVAADQRRNTRVGLSNTINDPGNAELAITVGATHRDMPHTYGVSYFSSKGPTGDGRLKPDLVAPGERIISCAAGANLQFIKAQVQQQAKSPIAPPAPQRPSADYIDESGTSMAAPHVSGAIAAFLSIRREFIGKPLEVKRIFLDSATSLGRERYFEGHGLLDSMRAIQSV